jgi:myxalamid-type polyketide synthase MxaB
MLESAAELYVAGAPIDWSGFDRDYTRRRVELPHYPFQRKRYWAKSAELDLAVTTVSGTRGKSLHPLLGRRLPAAVNDRVFESQLSANRPPILADHKIQGVVIMPGAAFIEMAAAASVAAFGMAWDVLDLTLVQPLLLDKQAKNVQTIVTPEAEQGASFRVVSWQDEEGSDEPTFTVHATGKLKATTEPAPPTIDLATDRARFTGDAFDEAWHIEATLKSGTKRSRN